LTVRLTPEDLAAVRGAAPSLAADLADGALAFARGHGYSLLDRPTVSLRADPSVEGGDIVVDVTDPRLEEPDLSTGADDAVAMDASPAAGGEIRAPSPVLEGAADEPRPVPSSAFGDRTAVFVVPISDGPHATLRELRPDGSSRTIIFDGRPLTIGRGHDNGLVVRDGRASRHHARIDGRRGTLVLSDLGSTNGSFVNDRRIESVALGAGDRIRIGTTAYVVEALGDEVAPADALVDSSSWRPADTDEPAD
jgi:hypothetical protein